MAYFLIFFAAFCGIIYLLYLRGILVSKNIAAILFVFWGKKEADRAVLDACTGQAKHVGRFHESRIYHFVLDAQLSEGDVEVVLLDRKKQELLRLNRQAPSKSIELNRKCRYDLCWVFQKATGECQLHW